MKKIIKLLLDLLFPRSETLKELGSLSNDEIFKKCTKSLFYKNRIWTIFCYKDKFVREMMWQMKFNSERKYAEFFGWCLYKKIIETINSGKKYILIPVPIHKKRRKERGFNQCEWLCEQITKIDKEKNFIYEPKILERIIYKKKQSWSNKKDRLINIGGVFRIIFPQKITNKSIIIIDDVLTTGATLEEIIKTINVYKPKEILAFTIAH